MGKRPKGTTRERMRGRPLIRETERREGKGGESVVTF